MIIQRSEPFLQCVKRLDQAIRMVPIDNLAPPLPMQDGSYEYERRTCDKLDVIEVDKRCFFWGGEWQTIHKFQEAQSVETKQLVGWGYKYLQ